jgi:hypothetical protein
MRVVERSSTDNGERRFARIRTTRLIVPDSGSMLYVSLYATSPNPDYFEIATTANLSATINALGEAIG